MSYNKLGFTSGQTLKAEHLNHMEEGIANVSWNDLNDKPFGDETPAPIVWDGNKEGHETVDLGTVTPNMSGVYIVHVSDVLLTKDMCIGATVRVKIGTSNKLTEYILTEDKVVEGKGGVAIDTYRIISTSEASESLMGFTINLPKPGTYFVYQAGTIEVRGIEFPSQVKTIDPKYIKDMYYDETPEPIVWDGNAAGRDAFDFSTIGMDGMYLVKVSEDVLTKAQVRGATITTNGGSLVATDDLITEDTNGTGAVMAGEANLVSSPVLNCNFSFGGTELTITLPSTGTYVSYLPSASSYVQSVAFVQRVKPLDEKYMPILTSPSGKKFKITVDDTGAITATEVTE